MQINPDRKQLCIRKPYKHMFRVGIEPAARIAKIVNRIATASSVSSKGLATIYLSMYLTYYVHIQLLIFRVQASNVNT